MKKTGLTDYDAFRQTVLKETGVSFCTRLHFGRPLEGENNYYIRMAYSGIEKAEIKEGLKKFKEFIEANHLKDLGVLPEMVSVGSTPTIKVWQGHNPIRVRAMPDRCGIAQYGAHVIEEPCYPGRRY